MNQGFGRIWTYEVMTYLESTIPVLGCVKLQNVSIKIVGLLTEFRTSYSPECKTGIQAQNLFVVKQIFVINHRKECNAI
jgi:hypothetical protein